MFLNYSLDIRSLTVVCALTALCLGAGLGVAVGTIRKHSGLGIWSAGYLVAGVGYALLWTRGTWPDFASIVLANSLVVLGGSCFVVGIDRFLGYSDSKPVLALIVLPTIGLLAYYTFIQPSIVSRIIVVSIVLGGLGFTCTAKLLLRIKPGARVPQVAVAVLFALHGAIMMVRAFAVLGTRTGPDLFSPNLFTTLTLLDFILLSPSTGLGLLAMVFKDVNAALESEIAERKSSDEKLRQTASDLEHALKEIKTLQGIIPICGYCKKIRDDSGVWKQLEVYISMHSDAEFSHGVCPDCVRRFHPEV
ncbi:MAG: hypothetical protein HUU46_09330 [Candidatus Hydrogenedentes bacterium]|nr:hypothetical protein [Candidatus Hydrogenedentota bacterium]